MRAHRLASILYDVENIKVTLIADRTTDQHLMHKDIFEYYVGHNLTVGIN